MLVSFSDLLREHQRRGTAAGAFTCYNFETAIAVLAAATERAQGIILLVSEQSFRSPHGVYLVSALQAMAERAPTPVCVQLDHVRDPVLVEVAFRSGVGAVMADGSHLPFEENLAFVRAAATIAARHGGAIEVELGRIEGDEDTARAATVGGLTDPEAAAAFVAGARPACLAVSIGNVHGIYRHPPALEWKRLEAIRSLVDVPLALHGASGVSEADLRRAIDLGIAKVNVNTELRVRYLEATAAELPRVLPEARVLDLNRVQASAVEAVAAEKMTVYAAARSVECER